MTTMHSLVRSVVPLTILFVAPVLVRHCSAVIRKPVPKVAIVGGGIGGTSTAYFLQQLFGTDQVVVDIYEAKNIGGRLATVDIGGKKYESGGSVIHSRNRYMNSFAKAFGLSRSSVSEGLMGLWDGSHCVFKESSWTFLNNLKLLWRYGFGIFKLESYIDDTLTKFESIYYLQNKGESFRTVRDLLGAMSSEFPNQMDVGARKGFKQIGFSDRLIDEIIEAAMLVNYGQSVEAVHQFVASVSVAGAIGSLWKVHGGNYLVAENLLKASQAQLVRDRVVKISRREDSTFVVERETSETDEGTSELSRIYDIVILAAPLASNANFSIQFEGFSDKELCGQYQRTISTALAGTLNHTYFGFHKIEDVPDEILLCNPDQFFRSVSRIYPVDAKSGHKKSNVWKIFSPIPLKNEELSLLFTEYDAKSVQVADWLAYPSYKSLPKSSSFQISENLYSLNAIEWAASAMEMSAIGAKNVALLAYKTYTGKMLISSDFDKSIQAERISSDEL